MTPARSCSFPPLPGAWLACAPARSPHQTVPAFVGLQSLFIDNGRLLPPGGCLWASGWGRFRSPLPAALLALAHPVEKDFWGGEWIVPSPPGALGLWGVQDTGPCPDRPHGVVGSQTGGCLRGLPARNAHLSGQPSASSPWRYLGLRISSCEAHGAGAV